MLAGHHLVKYKTPDELFVNRRKHVAYFLLILHQNIFFWLLISPVSTHKIFLVAKVA